MMGRWILLLFLILVIFVSINPQAQTKISGAWQSVRPAVLESMDHLYAVVRDFVAGNDSDHHIDDNPAVPDPNLIVIIT